MFVCIWGCYRLKKSGIFNERAHQSIGVMHHVKTDDHINTIGTLSRIRSGVQDTSLRSTSLALRSHVQAKYRM